MYNLLDRQTDRQTEHNVVTYAVFEAIPVKAQRRLSKKKAVDGKNVLHKKGKE